MLSACKVSIICQSVTVRFNSPILRHSRQPRHSGAAEKSSLQITRFPAEVHGGHMETWVAFCGVQQQLAFHNLTAISQRSIRLVSFNFW